MEVPAAGGVSDLSGVRATWFGVGDAQVGDTVDDVGRKLGVVFEPVKWSYKNNTRCGTTVDSTSRIGLVISGSEGTDERGTVDSFMVGTAEIAFVDEKGTFRIGTPIEAIQVAYPYVSEDTGMSSAAGGRLQLFVHPPHLSPPNPPFDRENVGRSAKFDSDPDGLISLYEVGAYRTVLDPWVCRA